MSVPLYSPAATRALARVSPIYTGPLARSIFEAIGLSTDESLALLQQIMAEANLITSDEMLSTWEALYGIVPPFSATPVERKRAILSRRQTKIPMSPWGLGQRIGSRFNQETIVFESGANTITAEMTEMSEEPTPLSLYALNKYIEQTKPAHLQVERHITPITELTFDMITTWETVRFLLCGETEDLL